MSHWPAIAPTDLSSAGAARWTYRVGAAISARMMRRIAILITGPAR